MGQGWIRGAWCMVRNRGRRLRCWVRRVWCKRTGIIFRIIVFSDKQSRFENASLYRLHFYMRSKINLKAFIDFDQSII